MRSSVAIAALIALALIGWFASGQPAVRALFGPAEPTAQVTETVVEQPIERRARVRVMLSDAQPVAREIVVHGRTEPDRQVVLKAETYGRVAEVFVDNGSIVAAGDPIVRLDPREREAMVAQARALVRQRELEDEAARQLGQRGYQAENRVAEVAAFLEAARAELRQREVELGHTQIAAPFAGAVDERFVEVGDFVDIGDPIADLIELDPFLVTGEVAQNQRALLSIGMPVSVDLADGRTIEGRLRFVARSAEAATRTFRVEVEVANGDGSIPAGMSATSKVRFAEVAAHELSAALLALGTHHELGVKIVDEQDVVRFAPVDLIRADSDSVWVAGLPDQVRVIVVGQGFVQDGESVLPVAVGEAALASATGTAEASR